MRLPQSIADIDAAWLTEALAARYPGTVVTSATHGTAIHGTATKLRLLLDYNDAGHAHALPPTLWFKGGLEAHSGGDEFLSVYVTESAFYADVAPHLSLTLPRCHLAYVDPTTRCSALLLEDMLARNARFAHITQPSNPQLAASVLAQFARLHGASWNRSELLDHPALAGNAAKLAQFVAAYNLSTANWARCLTLPRARYVSGVLTDRNAMAALIQRQLQEHRDRACSLVHGDAHLGNVCVLPGDQASFLDWQTAMRGFWAHDVAYFLAGALSVEHRREHERALLRGYVAELNRAGGKITEEEAWWEYRRHAIYAFAWFGCAPEWTPEDVICRYTERAVAAIVDLDTLGAWRD